MMVTPMADLHWMAPPSADPHRIAPPSADPHRMAPPSAYPHRMAPYKVGPPIPDPRRPTANPIPPAADPCMEARYVPELGSQTVELIGADADTGGISSLPPHHYLEAHEHAYLYPTPHADPSNGREAEAAGQFVAVCSGDVQQPTRASVYGRYIIRCTSQGSGVYLGGGGIRGPSCHPLY